MNSLVIADRMIGDGAPCFVIAEAGVNHNGDLSMALALVRAAANAGADAVKFQTFNAARLVTRSAPKAMYQKAATGESESQYEMLKRLELDESAHRLLMAECQRCGIMFLSTPFESDSADLLERLGVSAYKLPSGEITNLPLLDHVARKNRPIILSTGMSHLDEVRCAVEVIRYASQSGLALLHCVTAYPTAPSDVNLRAMATLSREFELPVGFSDHTEGIDIALAAVALGACILEKHFTLDRSLPGPDHKASLEPIALTAMIHGIRRVESSLGNGVKCPRDVEAETSSVVRKSIVASRDIAAGERLDATMIAIRRPGTGLPPSRFRDVLNRTLSVAVSVDTPITENMLL